MYKELRASRSEFVPIRGLTYHVRIWDAVDAGQPAEAMGAGPGATDHPGGNAVQKASSLAPPLVLVHGWMDVAASYQFMVDALSNAFASGRTIIAPDWRGFGQTCRAAAAPPADTYWFPDYLADLDLLLDHYAANGAVDLVGHSMGGNIAMVYAGVRPARIRRLVNLEGFGLPASKPAQAATRYATWMDEIKSLQRGEVSLKTYDDVAGVSGRLMKTNPRLSPERAGWLASHWSRPGDDGRRHILGDAAHKVTSANLYRADETLEIYKSITAPVLAVEAGDDSLATWWKGRYTLAEYHQRLENIAVCRVAVVDDAGHMVHHDQPEKLAALIEEFLA